MIDHEVLPLADHINLLLARTLLFLAVRQANCQGGCASSQVTTSAPSNSLSPVTMTWALSGNLSKDAQPVALAETGIITFNYADRQTVSIPGPFLQAWNNYQNS